MKKHECTQAEWDARCKQCGRCCYEKLEDARGKIIYTDVPCEFLDVENNRCSVFEERFVVNPICTVHRPNDLPEKRAACAENVAVRHFSHMWLFLYNCSQ